MKRLALVWFRNNLRLHDNEVLAWAHANNDFVNHFYCFDPRQITEKTYKCNFVKTDRFRLKFLIETIENLNASLISKGSSLFTYRETPEKIFQDLIEKYKNDFEISIGYHLEFTKEETDIEEFLRRMAKDHRIQLKEFWTTTLYHPDDIPYNSPKAFPDVYTQFRVSLEKQNVRVRRLTEIPTTFKPTADGMTSTSIPSLLDYGYQNADPHSSTVFPYRGGETAALSHLQTYIWDKQLAKTYKQTRNALVGSDNSTKFSPWLANGSLSARLIFFELKRYERESANRDAGYWIIFELLWRDFFKFTALKYGTRLFFASGLRGEAYSWKENAAQYEAWRTGQTGIPFVDANMREILQTGWMSNRGRQNVASFLTKDLGIDWRFGAVWFESILIDHDVCSNYGNWVYVAGVGNDPRENRHFNMIKQAFDYDAEATFVRTWCPELARLPNEFIHTPWLAPAHVLRDAAIELGVNYPRPIMIATQWNQQSQNRRKSAQNAQQTQQRGINFYFKNNKKRS